jgi:branched-chain amino acid transport system permease protein
MVMHELATVLIGGLLVGFMYSLAALGFVVIYKCSSIFNLAHGELVMLGGFLVAALTRSYGFPLYGAVLISLCVMVALALGLARGVFRPLTGRGIVAPTMATLALGIIVRHVLVMLWGPEPKTLPAVVSREAYMVGGVPVAPPYVLGFCLTVAAFVVLFALFQRTRAGIALRAVADDQVAAMAVGMNVERLMAVAWGVAGVLAIAAAYAWGTVLSVSENLVTLGIRSVVVALMGGLDSLGGLMVAGPMVGLAEFAAGRFLDPTVGGVSQLVPFPLILLTLLVRPTGLFGREIIERV